MQLTVMATTEEVATATEAAFKHLSLIRDSRTNLSIELVGTKHLSKLLKD